MKSIVTIFLAAILWTGCYTQVRSSGDYWGYTGRHEREKVYAEPNQVDSMAMQDTTGYANDQRGREDEGYSSGEMMSENPSDYSESYAGLYAPYYASPSIGLSVGFGYGWHRPWWGLGFGYSSWYPSWDPYYYNPYWDWYYAPGFSAYGCLGTPFYPYYGGFGFYGGYYRHGFGGDHFGLRGGIRSGRINGGESRGIAGSGTRAVNSVNPTGTGRSNIIQRSTAVQSGTARSAGNPQQNGSSAGRANSRYMNNMSAPRNNPRLVPQGGRLAQNSRSGAPRGYANAPRGGYSGGGMYRGNGGGYRGGSGGYSGGGYRGGGGGGYRGGGGGGGARSGGGGGHRGR
jgi:hypothetical protein